MIGETIGHYTVLQKLGEGGMGAVYLVEGDRMNGPGAAIGQMG